MAKSNITIAALDTMSATEIGELPMEVLLDLQRDLEQFVDTATTRANNFRNALDLKFGQQAMDRLNDRKAESGTVALLEENYVCEVDVPKTIEWDQTKLGTLWDHIAKAGQDPLVYMKRALSVSDTAIRNWPPDVQASFREARSYKNGRKRFKLREAKTTDRN